MEGIISKNNDNYYCLNLPSFFYNEIWTWYSYEKVCKNKDFNRIKLLSQKDNILQFSQYMKSYKIPCIIYADLESFI